MTISIKKIPSQHGDIYPTMHPSRLIPPYQTKEPLPSRREKELAKTNAFGDQGENLSEERFFPLDPLSKDFSLLQACGLSRLSFF
ncbi:hypothetical protein SAMN02745704_02491, partial [Paucidesulfovibrio gracilis DSM 16080]